MTPEAQRIAIAEVCGWASCYDDLHIGLSGYPPEDTTRTPIPDYLSDLNAMHEAEMTLNWDEQTSHDLFNYRCALDKICGHDRDLIPFASAAQRAEAFLRVAGRWDDSK